MASVFTRQQPLALTLFKQGFAHLALRELLLPTSLGNQIRTQRLSDPLEETLFLN